ncbi:MAG: hypothetical protein QM736_19620 [Vicinamibacterales bacterium]
MAAPTSGRATALIASAPSGAESSSNATPAPATVTTRVAMLKSVRCSGCASRLLRTHWLNALAAATSRVWSHPRSSSDAKSIAYDTDIVDTLVVSGSVIFMAALADESTNSVAKSQG